MVNQNIWPKLQLKNVQILPKMPMCCQVKLEAVQTGIWSLRTQLNSPPSKLAPTSMPQSWQKNVFLPRKYGYFNFYVVFPNFLMFLTLFPDFTPSESYLKTLKWGRVCSGGRLNCAQSDSEPSRPYQIFLTILFPKDCHNIHIPSLSIK